MSIKYSIKEAAILLNVKYQRLFHLISCNIIPSYKSDNNISLDENGLQLCKEIISKNLFYSDIRLIKKNYNINNKEEKTEIEQVRLTKKDKLIVNFKSILSSNKSSYIRDSLYSYWPKSKECSDSFFQHLSHEYKNSNEENKNIIIEILFYYYRNYGFPYFELSEEDLNNEMDKIVKTTINKILLENNLLQSNVVGLSASNYWHKHLFETKTSDNTFSPYEAFLDDEKLKDCIKKWLDMGNVCNHIGMRKILRTRNGIRSAVNFKPTIAKTIYDIFVPENGNILDPCSGFSGRLLGCIGSNRNLLYHGIDVDSRTASGNMNAAGFYLKQKDIYGKNKYNFRFRFDLGCAEDVMGTLEENFYDIIFTSPPYFDLEKYSEDYDQSFMKHKTYDKWLENFMFKIINHSECLLKDNGKLILNIKNIKNYNIANDILDYCKNNEWNLTDTYYMKIFKSEFHRNKGANNFNVEPIFVFSKQK